MEYIVDPSFCREYTIKLCQQILLTEYEFNADTNGYGSVTVF